MAFDLEIVDPICLQDSRSRKASGPSSHHQNAHRAIVASEVRPVKDHVP